MSQNDENFKPQNSTEVDPSFGAKHESRVRNIPIFLEGRNETIMNADKTDSYKASDGGQQQGHQFPPSKFINNESSKSLFDRVKDIPMRSYIPSFDQARRSASPSARLNQKHSNIPLTKAFQQSSSSSSTSSASSGVSKDQQQHKHEKFEEFHKHQNSNNRKQHQSYDHSQNVEDQYNEQLKQYQQQRQQQFQQRQLNRDDPRYDQTFTKPEYETPIEPTTINNPISKINSILNEVTMLSEKVQKFPYNVNRDSKDYLYLDEMLTQNLLKLDLIDTEGKDEIKAYRKEVINCINKNISNLEAKLSSVSSMSSLESNASGTNVTTTPSSKTNEI